MITVNRPEKRNALSRTVLSEISAVLDAWQDDPAVQAVVFTGAGEKALVAGADTDQRTGLLLERLAQTLLYTTEDKAEGAAAFLASAPRTSRAGEHGECSEREHREYRAEHRRDRLGHHGPPDRHGRRRRRVHRSGSPPISPMRWVRRTW